MERGALIWAFAVVFLPHDLCVCLPNTMPKPQRKNRDALACIAFLFAVGPVGLKQNLFVLVSKILVFDFSLLTLAFKSNCACISWGIRSWSKKWVLE